VIALVEATEVDELRIVGDPGRSSEVADPNAGPGGSRVPPLDAEVIDLLGNAWNFMRSSRVSDSGRRTAPDTSSRHTPFAAGSHTGTRGETKYLGKLAPATGASAPT
jgi:hypothetical protein